MPQFDVTAPDGKTWTVNAPEGASEQDAIAYVQKNHYSQQPAAKLSDGDRFKQGLIDPIEGGAQLLTKLLPESIVKAGDRANNWLADKTGLVARLPEGGVDQQVREREAEYQQARGPDQGIDWLRLGGNVLSPANLAIAARMPAAATTAGRVMAGAGGGAVSAMLNPVAGDNPGDFASDKAKQIVMGAGFGGAVPLATAGVARIISPKAAQNSDVQLLKSEGVTPTIGQSLGGWANRLEEKLTSVPILGDAISGARERAQAQFNNAAINRASGAVGQKVEGAGQDAVKKAGDLISDVYDQAKTQLGGFAIDQQASQQLNALRNAVQFLPKNERATVNSYFKDYLSQPGLTAEAFKELDSKLAKDVARFSGASDAYQQKVGDALAQARTIIADNAKRSNPQAADLFQQADAAWANLVRVEGASKAALNAEGVFTPAQLARAVRGADTSVRDRATARGTALMQDLSTAGQNVLGNKVPNSGTFDRAAMGALLAGGTYLNPAVLAAVLGGGAMYTRPLQGILAGAANARPALAQPVAQALRNSTPMLVPMGAQAGLSFSQ